MEDYNWEQRTNEVKGIIQFILEGHTEEETKLEFGGDEKWLITRKRDIKNYSPEKYALILNKPFLVFQSMAYQRVSFEEASRAFKVTEMTFKKYMSDVLKSIGESDRKKYIWIKNVLAVRK